MINALCKLGSRTKSLPLRFLSVSAIHNANHSCKLLVIGGGSGGCTIAAKFARRLKKGSVIVLEPSSDHYYQPLFTLVGAGVTSVAATRRSAKSVLPSNATWLKDTAQSIDPEKNVVRTAEGHEIQYEYAVIAVGLQYNYDKVPGLRDALNDKGSGVSTIYSPDYCEKTWSDLKNFKGGEAVFTYPDTPIKCPGAPQKIAYMSDAYFDKTNIRSRVNITYNTHLPVIFGVKKYADILMKVVKKRRINVNYKTVLKEVRADKKEAVFFNADDKSKLITLPYDMLHVTPPMFTPEFLRNSADIVDAAGFLDVDKFTLQHRKYPNIYGIGDCTNTPNSKTAAAIAKQSYVVEHNLLSTMDGKNSLVQKYNGYGACPIVTHYGKCILAEFVYDGVPRETLPINQARESTIAYYMKRDLFPFLYWHFMLKGYYHGPEWVHYYQPLFTLVGAGMKPFAESYKKTQSILPPKVMWLKDEVDQFDPCNNAVFTKCGLRVRYDVVVIGIGLKNDYDKIPGLSQYLSDPLSPVSTIYSPQYCTKSWCCLQRFKGGHALFTFPKEVGKCSGAAQKIMYLAHDYWSQNKIRPQTSITYVTPKDTVFGIPKYAKALSKIAENKSIAVNYNLELVEVLPKKAIFKNSWGQTVILPYNFLHVTPPMSPPACLSKCSELVTDGYLNVDKHTLQHKRYSNVFGIGDCLNTPNSKTAAAVVQQSGVVAQNLWNTMYGKPLNSTYDGYGACPILTSYKSGIIAEFKYDGKTAETLPFDQVLLTFISCCMSSIYSKMLGSYDEGSGV
ncbi:unnamed protein product [Leptosia nina]|uniref:Sulfide:quinone oxidoreductase, mitochondrial n=1 Tax=Leptosia nina TaxID=320188 RepID=A0AAV1JD46_9NEOP